MCCRSGVVVDYMCGRFVQFLAVILPKGLRARLIRSSVSLAFGVARVRHWTNKGNMLRLLSAKAYRT